MPPRRKTKTRKPWNLRAFPSRGMELARQDFALPGWAMATLVVLIVALAVLLMLTQRRSGGAQSIPLMPPITESINAVAGLSGGVVTRGNAVELVENGAFFDSLIHDVEGAHHHVHLECFAWWTGNVCERLATALADAARRGASVRVLIDATGSRKADDSLLESMQKAGVQVCKYRPLGIKYIHSQNYRDHRRTVVIDGTTGYVMGHGIAEEWTGDGRAVDHWRDTGLRVRGPCVTALQSQFAMHWLEARGKPIVGAEYWPDQPVAGPSLVHIAASSSGDSVSRVEMLVKLALAASRQEVLIRNAYFSPDASIVKALTDAADRGVHVRIMVPGPRTDQMLVLHAGHSCYAELLRHGVQIYEYQPTMLHCKTMVVDKQWCEVGSTNLDARSLRMSEEDSMGVLDPVVATALADDFEADVPLCREWTTANWKRSILHHPFDAICWGISQQL